MPHAAPPARRDGRIVRVILFAFWGRRDNVRTQLPFIYRILDENPDVVFEGWDLTMRDTTGLDSEFLRSLPARDRFTIRTDFYKPGTSTSNAQNRVWKHYSEARYRNTVFAKIDDDVSFLETARFAEFAQAAADNPKHVVSALTINNGCSTRHIPGIWDIFQALEPSLPKDNTPFPELAKLLAVHRSPEFAEQCHRWFHQNWETLVNQPGVLVPTDDWLSINAISFSHAVCRRIASRIGMVTSRVVAGRPQRRVGDEGSANFLPRFIFTGFTAAHATFGPQVASQTNPNGLSEGALREIRKLYVDIATQYLSRGRIEQEFEAAQAVLSTP